jgi:hypothetical protein
VDALWWDGHVPEWIDVSVVSERGTHTVIELLVCGRYTAEEQLLYYRERPTSPCAVKGPVLPPDHREHQRFSIHLRESVVSPEELSVLAASLAEIQLLECVGFDDAALARLPRLPSVGVLSLPHATLSRLPPLIGLPNVHHCRVDLLPEVLVFDARGPHEMRSLTLGGLPPDVPGPLEGHLLELVLVAARLARPLVVASQLRAVSVTLDAGAVELAHGEAVEAVHLHGRAFDDRAVATLLERMPRVRSVDLRHADVGDALLPALERRGPLDFLDLVGTRVTPGGRARAARMARKVLPARTTAP